jgi:Ca2+-binding EF-hand superfamily protein
LATVAAEYDPASLQSLLAHVDSDRDGRITFPEFASFFAHLQKSSTAASPQRRPSS